jgi:D-serine dehydratase
MNGGLGDGIGSTFRGLPLRPGSGPTPEDLVGSSVLSGEVALPVALLKRREMEANAAWMQGFVRGHGVSIWPHGKTSMSPTLFREQIGHGAERLSVATATQAHVARLAGVEKILIANQVTNLLDLDYLAMETAQDDRLDVMCFVDSVEGVERLVSAWRKARCHKPISVLLEVGVASGRAGVRGLDDALSVARAVTGAEELTLAGLAGYEGVFTPKDPEGPAKVDRYLDTVAEIARALDAHGLFSGERVVLSAGGSKFFDIVVKKFTSVRLSRPVETVIRCGCYLFHDVGIYEEAMQAVYARDPLAAALGRLRPAMEVWAEIQSRPEKTRAIAAMGRRDASYDSGLPVPQLWCRPGAGAKATPLERHRVVALNDQHTFIDLPEDSPLQVGDAVGFGISHPCTVFDKWQMLCIVDPEYVITEVVRTFFT